MKAKIKRFFESTGFTKTQLITVVLCYFLCFALFLGVVVIWDPMSKSLSEQTIAADDTTLTGPTNVDGWWITEGRYSIEWFKNAQSVEIDGTTYQPGTKQNPYIIDSAEDLAGLSWLVYTKGQEDNPLVSGTHYSGRYIFRGKYFKQTANIDLSLYYWQPIGIYYTREGTARQNYFSGNYDGDNHTVSGIFTPAESSNAYSYQGLFGYVYSQSSSYSITIKNIGITNSFIQGYQYVGGVVGYAGLYTTITNCYNTGSVSGSSNIGGVVGYAYVSFGAITITNCYNTGSVESSGDYVGGVVGYASASSGTTTITNCYNTGTVSGSSRVGGVVGYAGNATITNCYNTGSVESSGDFVGGVVGYASGTTTTITNCYNTGSVESSGDQVGGVVGYAAGTKTITNCYNTGAVSGSGNYVGGVVGSADLNTTIESCYNTGTVSNSSYVGGVVGSSSDTTITNCYNRGTVTSTATGDSYVGGVVGYAGSNTTIESCYNTGDISGSSSVGGVVGRAWGTTITITNCYNTGSVESSGYQVGGVVGRAYGASGTITITNCYNTGDVSGSSSVGGVVGSAYGTTITNCYYGANCPKTVGGINGEDVPGQAEFDSNIATNAKTLSWYTTESNWNPTYRWDFENVWVLDSGRNDGYPSFIITYWISDPSYYSIEWFNNPDTETYGDGSESNPYIIDSAEDLAGLSWLVYTKGEAGNPLVSGTDYSGNYIFQGKYFKQTANIDLSAYHWQPIGIYYTRDGTRRYNYFSGSYDGGNHAVSGIFTPAGSSVAYSYQGLFGYVYSQSSSYPVTIQNIGITNSFIQGYQYVGGVVGYAYAYSGSGTTTITNCYNTGSVTSSGPYVGGVVGYASGTTIESCYNIGSVSGSGNYVGGVVGYADAYSSSSIITITNCYNTGSVSGSSYVGGVVGRAGSNTTIESCYNTGSVSGSSSVGGVVGSASTNTAIANCYNTGSVSGSGDNVGGVVGYANASSSGTITITNCYNTGSVSGSSSVGGVVGDAYSNTTITNCYNTGSVSGSSYVGGVVGDAGPNTTIANCYNTGSVSGSGDNVGGVVGYANASSSGTITITNCYNTGSVESTGSYVGGVVGRNTNATITNCYYGANCSLSVGGIEGADVPGQAVYDANLTTETPKTLSWYTTPSNWNSTYPWDFENVWVLDSSVNDGYPSFIVPVDWWINEGYYSIEWFNNPDTETYGDGSASNPYIIDSAEDLAGLSYLVYTKGQEYNPLVSGTDYSGDYIFQGKFFKQTEDIDLSAHVWQPIGISYTRDGTSRSNYFSGNYDGGNHTVSRIFTPAGSSDAYSDQGLFGCCKVNGMYPHIIENIGITNSNIQGYEYVGGVVGYSHHANITNCYNAGTVAGVYERVGGIAGYSYSTAIYDCYNAGTISGSRLVGGIAGSNGNATITNCYNTGSVSGQNEVGGIVGSGYVKKSYNEGEISGVSDVGGIIGVGGAKSCYNLSSVFGTTNVGGIVGGPQDNAGEYSYAIDCYNVGSVTGESNVAGIIGCAIGTQGICGPINSNINIGNVQGTSNVNQIANSYDSAIFSTNYFNSGSASDSVEGATYDENLEDHLRDENWLSENLFWDFGFTYKIAQNNFPTIRTEEEIDSWLNESLVKINTNWEGLGTIDNPYKISSAKDLAGLALAVNTGMKGDETLEYSTIQTALGFEVQVYFQDVYFEQTTDIDLSSHFWESIGIFDYNNNTGSCFGGSYDGCGYKISGLKSTADAPGLFGWIVGEATNKVKLKNINIDNCLVVSNSEDYPGYVLTATAIDAEIENCVISGDAYCKSINSLFSPFVGLEAVGTTIKNCKNYCNVVDLFGENVCGVFSYALFTLDPNSPVVVENCKNYGNISGFKHSAGISYISISSEIINCENYGSISVKGMAAGIVYEAEDSTITRCNNYGNVLSNGEKLTENDTAYLVGVAGDASNTTISNCNNYGNISAELVDEGGSIVLSGIVGQMVQSTVDNCNNYGEIDGDMVSAGICCTALDQSIISNTVNYGNIISYYYSSGILYANGDNVNITNCQNIGKITSNMFATGIVSIGNGSLVITDCASFGELNSQTYAAGILGFTSNHGEKVISIANCLVDLTANVLNAKGATSLYGGIIDMPYDSISVLCDKCSVNLNIVADNVETAISSVFEMFEPEFDMDIREYRNSYGRLFVNGELYMKQITDITSGMEGNFVYLDGFYDDMPVPIKSDGSNFFHMHDFGLTTGIIDKINEIFYPNLLKDSFTTNSVKGEMNEQGEQVPIVPTERIPYELNLIQDKEYVVTLYIDGVKIVKKLKAETSPQENLKMLAFGNDGTYLPNGLKVYAMYIISGGEFNLSNSEYITTPGQSSLLVLIFDEEQQMPVECDIQLTEIREMPATNL